MKFTYTVKDPAGIHARPAGLLVAEAKKYGATITMRNKGRSADAKRIFAIMGLCVKTGEEIEIECVGADEEAAGAAIKAVLEANL